MKIIVYTLLMTLSLSLYGQSRQGFSANRFELLSGVRENKNLKNFWDKKYASDQYIFGKAPAKFIATNYEYIPRGSNVLDVGMGEGRNAVFLARKGYKVVGVDISSVAIKKALSLAKEFSVRIESVVSSMEKYNMAEGTLDAIICFYYVDRRLNEKLVKMLKPGGIMIYEAYTMLQRKVKGSENYEVKYLLKPGELLGMFPGMKVLKYEEPLHEFNFPSSIILQKL